MAECANCHIALVIDDEPSEAVLEARRRSNDLAPVVAFETDDPVLLAMAKQALDKADIPFLHNFVQPRGTKRWTWQPDSDVPAKLVVNADDAEEAAAVLANLAPESADPSNVDAPVETKSNTEVMAPPKNVHLHNADTNQPLGEITEDELQVLFDQLERESDSDDDFFVDAATIEMLEDAKAPAHLVETLRKAVGSSEGVEVRWKKAENH